MRNNKMKHLYGFYLTIICAVFLLPGDATAQSGGNFIITQSVITSGGGS